ncbi:MAG: site-specific integrase [Rikenellaceae bacterium]
MASVKLKFKVSKVRGREGILYFQILQKRVCKQIITIHKIFNNEWDNNNSEIIINSENTRRTDYLQSVKRNTSFELKRLKSIIIHLQLSEQPYECQDIIEAYKGSESNITIYTFTNNLIEKFKEVGRLAISDTYSTTLRSFMRFRGGVDIELEHIDSDLMICYENYLKKKGTIPNSTSFYMRVLRAIYNRAVEKEIIQQRYPFKHVYTGVDKTTKRAISVNNIKKIKELDLSHDSFLECVRDMFIFSFLTRGMSFIDMAFLRKKDLKSGILTYCRRKTNQQLQIKWENCMQEIIDKYDTSETQYLLPIIKNSTLTDRNQYRITTGKYNKRLKIVGKMAKISIPLTMYVARHSWASAAKKKNIPISVISEGLGHDSESTTQIYLASLDADVVDKANNAILKLL